MATNTYVALDKITVGSAVSSVTFSSISQGYTDLVLVVQGTMATGSGAWLGLQFNGDTATNYSDTRIYGNGSAAGSIRRSNQTIGFVGALYSGIGQFVCNIQNYSNATTYKTIISRNSSPTSGEASAFVALWRKTPEAITSMRVIAETDTIAVGTTFSLYGIRAEGTSPAPKATGGAIYSDSTYYYHVFGQTGTFTPLQSLSADVLVVAGGGGGGSTNGGGAGAGGVLSFTSQSLASGTGYTCTVGAGGTGAGGGSYVGTNGGDSQFGALTLVKGGGYGGSYSLPNGATGGSGGGGAGGDTLGSGGSATSGQGTIGSSATAGQIGGGGGGAGVLASGKNGGNGTSAYNTWSLATGLGQNVSGTYYIAGGGGAGTNSGAGGGALVAGTGGYGGGANGNNQASLGQPAPAQISTGSGGGGSGGNGSSAAGGNGGSGVVIVRYLKA